MTSDVRGLYPESTNLIAAIMVFFQDAVSPEERHLLLTDDEAWESFVAEAELSREEAEALREGLNKLETDLNLEDEDGLQRDHLERERFLNEFPRLKQKLEGHIRKLHELADKVDKVHKDCTISNIVASATGTVSGVLTILGLGLAPVTAGVSLTLLTAGMGLGAAAAITGVSTSIVEHSHTSSAQAEASRMPLAGKDKGETIAKALCENAPKIISLTRKSVQALQDIGKNVRAIKVAKASPRLVARAKQFMTAGRVSVRTGKQVQKAFGGTALAMTKGARIMGAATAGIFLLMDVVNLVEESKHLHGGAKAESADKLRLQAQELESKLKELIQIHECLN